MWCTRFHLTHLGIRIFLFLRVPICSKTRHLNRSRKRVIFYNYRMGCSCGENMLLFLHELPLLYNFQVTWLFPTKEKTYSVYEILWHGTSALWGWLENWIGRKIHIVKGCFRVGRKNLNCWELPIAGLLFYLGLLVKHRKHFPLYSLRSTDWVLK